MNRILNVLVTIRLFIEQQPLVLFIGLFIVIGSNGVWLNYPLSGALQLADLKALPGLIYLPVVTVTILLFYCILLSKQINFAATCCAAVLFFALLFCSINISFFNAEGLLSYTTESRDMRSIQHILALNPVPNAGRSIESPMAFDFFRLQERVATSLSMLGWGAKLAILFSGFLLIRSVLQLERKTYGVAMIGIMALFLLPVSGFPQSALAYLSLNQAIKAANANQPLLALEKMRQVEKTDPVLASSNGFSFLTSYFHYALNGESDPDSYAYRMSKKFDAGLFDEVLALHRLNKNGHETLQLQGRPDPLFAFEHFIVASTHTRLGFQKYIRGQWVESEELFYLSVIVDQSLPGKMALMSIFAKTERAPQCLAMAEDLLEHIKNVAIAADIWSTRGDCLIMQGNIDQARKAYEKSISLDNDKNYRAVKGLSGT